MLSLDLRLVDCLRPILYHDAIVLLVAAFLDGCSSFFLALPFCFQSNAQLVLMACRHRMVEIASGERSYALTPSALWYVSVAPWSYLRQSCGRVIFVRSHPWGLSVSRPAV